jgi:selenide,water dikinase
VRLDDGRCLIQTLDFFTPIVDDAYTFGAIAATNSLSDVYAMGGLPLTAMNILCWPHRDLPPELLADMLRGGADKVIEAGALLVGGHSVTDSELKFGLSVTGEVREEGLWSNAGAEAGGVLVLTKAVGTGVLSTALKRGECPEDAETASVRGMLTLNRAARDAGAMGVVHACTDVTGNGLVGHAWEIARASGVRLVIESASVPLLPWALQAAAAGHLTRGEKSNRRYVGEALSWGDVSPALQSVLVDPQTSGGLLFALPEADAARLVAAGVGVVIGRVEAGEAAIAVV